MRGAREPRATVHGVGAGSRPGGRPVVSQKALAERTAVGPSRKSGCMKGAQAGKGTEDPRWPGRGTRVSLVSVAGQRSTRRCLRVDIGSERKQKKTELTQRRRKDGEQLKPREVCCITHRLEESPKPLTTPPCLLL